MNFTQIGIVFSQDQRGIKNTWLLLDTYLPNSVSNNPIMVKNVDKFNNNDIFMVQKNGGLKYFFYTASLHNFPLKVHYNPYSKATILELRDVTNISGARITTDTSKEKAMFIKLEIKSYKFRKCASIIYC